MKTNNTNRFLRFFYPSDEMFAKLSLREKTQLPVLVATNILWVIIFSISGVLISFNVLIGGIAAIITSLIFAMALVAIKKGKIYLGSKIATAGNCLLGFIVAFFTTRFPDPMVFYKTVCMLIIMGACNLPISINQRQIIAYIIVSFLIWVSSSFSIYFNLFQTDLKGSIIAFSICTIGLFISNGAMYLATRFFNSLIIQAEENKKKSDETVQTITKVIEESKAGLDIGEKLIASSNNASKSVSEISELYLYLATETETLNTETNNVKTTSSQITTQANDMKASVNEQNAAITETSAAMTEISANITNINTIASKRRAGMNDIVLGLDAQLNLIKDLVAKVEQVTEYSKSIEGFVNTVDSIASQTGLLAMNASIEAAHAGTLGKGFSVIAQEIRKLSEETTKNAALISETLKENSGIVKETSESVSFFAQSTIKSSNEIKSTMQAIEEILAGISEMDIGTQEVMRALQNIVDEAHTNSNLINAVVSEIENQTTSIDNIADFSQSLEEKVSGLDELLRVIKMAISDIKQQAEQNQEVATKIGSITD